MTQFVWPLLTTFAGIWLGWILNDRFSNKSMLIRALRREILRMHGVIHDIVLKHRAMQLAHEEWIRTGEPYEYPDLHGAGATVPE
jgi:hypothetical protein